VLHTQVQEEHCREWKAFPDAKVIVDERCFDIAGGGPEFITSYIDKQSINTCGDWDTLRGMEEFGHGGCMTERPPVMPLNVVDRFTSGYVFNWEDQCFIYLTLPGSGKYSGGIYWQNERILFSGDLILKDGYTANLYDTERCYGFPLGYNEMDISLQKVINMKPLRLYPSSGAVINDPIKDCNILRERIAWVNSPVTFRENTEYSQINYQPECEFGRYKKVLPGLYQNNNAGNIVLYVDDKGRGLMIDPDPCVWLSWDENTQAMHHDLDLLEREAGLKTVEIVLLTHYHGDHVRFCDLLRKRYGTTITATRDIAANLLTHGIYPCQLKWYDLPFTQIHIDNYICHDQPFDWNGIPVLPIHTPGHCYAHTGFVIDWNGVRTATTGDTLQYGAGPIRVDMPVIYNDTAWPDRGFIKTFEQLLHHQTDLVLGGHSFSFFDDGILSDWHEAAKASYESAKQMIKDGDLLPAMTPPGFNELRIRSGENA